MPPSPLILGALAGAAAWTSTALAPVSPPVARAIRVPLRIPGSGVAVTFDDGPHPEGTPAVLRALAEANATATFFLVGEQVERFPALAAEIAAAGHVVAVHGHHHRNLLRLSPRQLATDLDRAVATISEATGSAPELYRPPYGIFSLAGPRVVRSRGLRPLLWSRWGHDWRASATAAKITREVAGTLRGGDVLLLHDADHYSASGSWRATARAVEGVLARIENAGLSAITPRTVG
jgi:peptidoglycan/xylan/chitin deacetylase (PgdA/CDA1 family)